MAEIEEIELTIEQKAKIAKREYLREYRRKYREKQKLWDMQYWARRYDREHEVGEHNDR